MHSSNISFTEHQVSLRDRWLASHHKSGILWFTGLSASGKTTLAFELERLLFQKGWRVFVLDGDNVRHGLCGDLGFSAEDRSENIRRIGEVAKLFAQSGCLVITAFISPYRTDRNRVRDIAGELFHEVHIATPLSVCEERDPKGLYRKARRGDLEAFTGIDAPYEPPHQPELSLDTSGHGLEESLKSLIDYVEEKFIVI
ncbi:MAG: adenylyl-sulfate kinase [Sulfuritalea sp.]|nr:adenylyl-sulfate kinase [Sulfuritalea sp.]